MNKVAFIIADDNNIKLANNLIKTIRHFHDEKELPIRLITGDDLKKNLEADRNFFYRATPIIANELFNQGYDFVLKLDADSFCLGDISHVWTDVDYDVGTVLNINRIDPQRYGYITTYVIDPARYYNNGFVALTNADFVKRWKDHCFSSGFDKLQFREQDYLNVMCHYGNWKIKCFDDYDPINNMMAWHGLVAKGEGTRMIVKDNKVILPKGEDSYPDRDVEIKMWHQGGGVNEAKGNYKIWFSDEVSDYIDRLLR